MLSLGESTLILEISLSVCKNLIQGYAEQYGRCRLITLEWRSYPVNPNIGWLPRDAGLGAWGPTNVPSHGRRLNGIGLHPINYWRESRAIFPHSPWEIPSTTFARHPLASRSFWIGWRVTMNATCPSPQLPRTSAHENRFLNVFWLPSPPSFLNIDLQNRPVVAPAIAANPVMEQPAPLSTHSA